MLKRIKQVKAALTAKISPDDVLFINTRLTGIERQLFYAMNLPDQRHAVNVAYTAIALAQNCSGVDTELLVKCALLHDIGKVRGDVSTADKIIAVLADKYIPCFAKRWGQLGRGGKIKNLRHALYIYYNHATRGAAMLKEAGFNDAVAKIVAKHHQEPEPGDCIELQLLRRADDRN